MKYCKKCVQTDTRPGIVFDDENICSACQASEKRNKIDWTEREKELQEIVQWTKKESKKRDSNFDCVVGVSGGKDSTFQALYSRDCLGLHPLLVNCAPDNISEVGRKNLENLVQHGFDMISIRPNPIIERTLSKYSFYKYGNFVKPLEYPLYAVTYMTALKYNIPLIIQGENPAITLGITKYLKSDGNALNWRDTPTLSGGNASDWVQEGIELKDLYFYQYPTAEEFKKKDVRGIYLGYYVKEWSNTSNTEFSVSRGLSGRPGHDPNKTGKINPYFSIDADLKVVNQMLKYLKFGFGSTTDEVCYDIREGRMTREEGIELVKKYDGKCSDSYIREWCRYIGITEKEFWKVTDKWVNKKLFRKNKWGKWEPKFTVGVDFEEDKECQAVIS